jgi:hypothetical protein
MNNDMIYKYFVATRNDGREFSGRVERVIENARGTLVTLMQYGETGLEYKNVYIQECRDWNVESYSNM